MPPTTHSKLGASSSDRWMNCPGSPNAEEGKPDISSPYAIEGTAAHDLAERALRSGLDCDVWVGDEIKVERMNDHGDGTAEIVVEYVEVTEEMAEHVQVFVDHVRELANVPGSQLMIEQRFSLEMLNPPRDMFGTADAVIWREKTRQLIVCDLKYGQGVAVDATENSQLRYYGLGAVLSLRKKPSHITMTIVQPRSSHPDGAIRSETITFNELVGFKKELLAAAERTMDPAAPLVPGEHCRFCKAAATCIARHATAVEIAQTEFEVFAPPKPEELSIEDMTKVLRATNEMRDWLTSVEAHAMHLLERGEEVPGFKLVPKRANRRWVSDKDAELTLSTMLGDAAYEKKLLSPAKAEKAIGKKKSEWIALERALVEKKSSGPKIVPDTDPRPALTPSVWQDFAAIPADEAETR